MASFYVVAYDKNSYKIKKSQVITVTLKLHIVKVCQFLYNKTVEGTYRRYFIVMLAH